MSITNLSTHVASGSVRANPSHVRSVVSFLRAANLTAYADLDAIGNATGTEMVFAGSARQPGGTGKVLRVHVAMSGSPTSAAMALILSSAVMAVTPTDNSAFTLSSVDITGVQAVIPLPAASVQTVGGYKFWTSELAEPVAFQCATTTSSMVGILTASAALTPVSAGVVMVVLELEQD